MRQRKIFSRLILLIFVISNFSFGPSEFAQPTKKVIFDHDGGIDDLLSLMLLTQMDGIELIGVCVTPADCFLEDATISSLKILKLTGHDICQVAKGNNRAVNPFPNEWRAQPMVANALPRMLNTTENYAQLSKLSADEFMAEQIRSSVEPVTILITGPCSNFVSMLEKHPELKVKINEVVWMGGAVDVGGNVATHKHNKTAEWNAYWDPIATNSLLKQQLNLRLISLDVTNSVPVNLTFLQRLAQQSEFPLSDIAAQLWATTINTISSYEYTYFMWDVLATSYVNQPGLFEAERIELDSSIELPNEGQTFRSPGNNQWVNVVKQVDVDSFYEYVLYLLEE